MSNFACSKYCLLCLLTALGVIHPPAPRQKIFTLDAQQTLCLSGILESKRVTYRIKEERERHSF